jgi:two-component system phosphate regulon sensor histidine kinase PhoR
MRLSIRWKLLATYLLVLLVMSGTLFLYLEQTLKQQLLGSLRENLFREAELIALLSAAPSGAAPPIHLISERSAARVSLIAASGVVLADSGVVDTDLATLENHGQRPEIVAARASGRGSAVRHSTTTGDDLLYVAVRRTPADPQSGFIRLALPLQEVAKAKAALRQSLALALLLAGTLAIGLSLLLFQAVTRRLERLREGAIRFGAGDFRSKLAIESADELGELAAVMNTMAERLQLQMESLKAQSHRLDTILRGMGEGLLVIDRDGTVRLFNPAFSALFALPEKASGRPLMEISRHPSLHATFRRILATRKEERVELALPEGKVTTLLTHWVPLLEEGGLIGVVAVFHDISELKRLEGIRRDFVANVSHELRTPVTVIRGYAETLGDGLIARDPATATRFAAVIRTHAERLTALISDLLTLSQLEAQGASLTLISTNLEERVRRSCALIAPQAEAKGIKLRSAPIPAVQVLADSPRLEQILFNLLDNAVKYTPAGGEVIISATLAERTIEVSISDNGPGIPPAAQERIFERFYRVDAGRSREEGGTGLGLAIVKHLVGQHGGTVRVANRPGGGSIFTITLMLVTGMAVAANDRD